MIINQIDLYFGLLVEINKNSEYINLGFGKLGEAFFPKLIDKLQR